MNNLRKRIATRSCRIRDVRYFSNIKSKSWIPEKEATLEDYTIKALTWEMEQFQRKSAERMVPWFLRNLPAQYFKEIDRDLQRDHLRALTALSEAGLAGNQEEETHKLCEFAAKGNLERLADMIAQGANPNLGDYDGRTPFHLAAAEGHLNILQYLGDLPGSNLNVKDRFGGTPYDDALRGGKNAVAEWLQTHGATMTGEGYVDAKSIASTTELMLKSRNQKYVSFFNNDFSPQTFRGLIGQLSLDRAINRAKGFVVRDSSMVLTVFEHGKPDFPTHASVQDPDGPAANVIEYFEKHHQSQNFGSRAELDEYLLHCPTSYVRHTPPEAFFMHKDMVDSVRGTEHCSAKIIKNHFTDDPNTYWTYLVSPNVWAHSEMNRFVNYLGVKGFKIKRFHMEQFDEVRGGLVIQRVLVETPGGIILDDKTIKGLERSMKRLKFLDDSTLLWYERRHPDYTLREVESLVTLGSMVYGPLNKDLPYAFTLDRVHQTIMMPEHGTLGKAIAGLFVDKFDPENLLSADLYEQRVKDIRFLIDETVQTNVWQRLFHKLLDAVEATYRTNLFLEDRMCLMLRIDPEIMMARKEVDRERPYGVFFGHARRCNGFHVRFREIARGGLRVVPALSSEGFGLESTRHFDEVYGLASAQQLKNKDIPEGGSKAVLLVNTKDRIPNSRDTIMRRCVKYFGDGILDVITPDEKTQSKLVDYWGKPELLYLGPDENIIPEDIVWLIDRAKVRGMKYPNAFMSSKPEAGINHKVYGVTSEGVAVFLQVALQQNGIDPFTQPFTVKLTGGPNGDVAGNMIRILRRDYPNTAKIVGMSDHSGSVENPEGLDMEELFRLHVEDLPVDAFNPNLLNDAGELHLVSCPEGTHKRNTMHNRIKADVFVPAGGRPNTINLLNWKHYMHDGVPSSPLIVEAANIYITPEARKKLGDEGVMIVKDSSANKAGVCCSSYEIVASMLLSKEEFMDVKEELVEDVLERLREIARLEAELLFTEARANPSVQIPDVAVNISHAITRAGDIFDKVLTERLDILDETTRRRLVVESLPNKLVEVAGERLDDLPPAYLRAMMAASLASKMVYSEGVDFVDGLEDEQLCSLASSYLYRSDQLLDLIKEVEGSDLAHRDEVVELLRLAGIKTALTMK